MPLADAALQIPASLLVLVERPEVLAKRQNVVERILVAELLELFVDGVELPRDDFIGRVDAALGEPDFSVRRGCSPNGDALEEQNVVFESWKASGHGSHAQGRLRHEFFQG